MAAPLSPTQEKELLHWLRAQSKAFSSALHQLLLMNLVLFSLRMTTMWYLSTALQHIIVFKQAPAPTTFTVLAGLFVAQSLLVLLKGWRSSQLEIKITTCYQEKIFQTLQGFHLALLRQFPIAHWQAHLMKRCPALSQFYLDFYLQQKLATITPVMVLAIVVPLNWLIALVLLVATPLIPVFMWITGMGAATAHRDNFSALDQLNQVFLDRLRGRRLIQLFNREEAEQQGFEKAGTELKKRTLTVVRLAFLSASVLDFFATIAMALVAVLVGFSLLGEINIGSWTKEPLNFQQGLFLLLMTPLFFAELKLLGRFYHTKSEAIGAAAAIKPLLAMQPSAFSKELDLQQQALLWPACQILDPNHQTLLTTTELSLSIRDRVFLQGPSGSGKSILLEAFLGLRHLNVSHCSCLKKEQVAWLGQQANLLPGSVRENLALDEPFTDEQLLQVLTQVELIDWLQQQPHGLDEIMGEHPPISGGQAQRLALARVLLFAKPIVLLDEPTAHLTESQHLTLTALLQQQLANKTVIWVSHRHVPASWFNQHWHLERNADGTAIVTQSKERSNAI